MMQTNNKYVSHNAILMKNKNTKIFTRYMKLLFIALFAAVLFSSSALAQGNLMITPRRVVFEGQQKTQELNLANTGSDTARYLISMIEIRMKEDGTFEKISVPDSGQNFASSYVRFFPRSVMLAPGEAQAVKIQLTKPAQMQAGEYRSHIYFRAVPAEEPLGENVTDNKPGISVHLTPVFGISIPVIIRVGEPNMQVNISDVSLEMQSDSSKMVHLVFNRTGNISAYGDLKIEYIPEQGKTIKVCEVKGIAVYTPTTSRELRINLSNAPGINLHAGKLHITYSTQADKKSSLKLAETDLVLL